MIKFFSSLLPVTTLLFIAMLAVASIDGIIVNSPTADQMTETGSSIKMEAVLNTQINAWTLVAVLASGVSLIGFVGYLRLPKGRKEIVERPSKTGMNDSASYYQSHDVARNHPRRLPKGKIRS